MKKILVIGCSFTNGSYVKNLDPNKMTPDMVDNHKGWWYYVDYFKDKDVTVVACSSQGYFGYLQIMLYMIKDLKWSFNEVWVQETKEPRICFNSFKKTIKMFQTPKQIDNFRYYATKYHTLLHLHSKHAKEENLQFSIHNDFNKRIVSAAFNIFRNVCKNNNIKGYRIAFDNYIKNNAKNPFVDIDENLHLTLHKAGFLVENNIDCHQTEEGNMYIGKLINKACIDMKI